MIETRLIEETKIFGLVLNPMRSNTEDVVQVAFSTEKEKLVQWYNDQMVEPYADEGTGSFECHGGTHTWNKTFRKGGPLEWMNPVSNIDGEQNHWGHGIFEQWFKSEDLPNISLLEV